MLPSRQSLPQMLQAMVRLHRKPDFGLLNMTLCPGVWTDVSSGPCEMRITKERGTLKGTPLGFLVVSVMEKGRLAPQKTSNERSCYQVPAINQHEENELERQ